MSSYAFVTNFASSSIASAFPLLATPFGFNRPLGELGYLISVISPSGGLAFSIHGKRY
jgi:hypothetical protein